MKGAGRWLVGCWVNNGAEQQRVEKWEANWRQIKVGARGRGHAETRNRPLTNIAGLFFSLPPGQDRMWIRDAGWMKCWESC